MNPAEVRHRLVLGDAVEKMTELPANSMGAVVTDPPYGLAFRSNAWDTFRTPLEYQTWTQQWAVEALRVLKPGGFLLSMGGTRTYHRMTCGIEDAGFRVLDCLMWGYLTGMPKALDVGKIFDKRAGAKRPVVGTYQHPRSIEAGQEVDRSWGAKSLGEPRVNRRFGADVRTRAASHQRTAPVTAAAKKWDGWKSPSLKPAWEPIVLAQKPPKGTIVDNLQKWGVGALNIQGCQIAYASPKDYETVVDNYRGGMERASEAEQKSWRLHEGGWKLGQGMELPTPDQGRYPSNMVWTDVLDDGAWKFFLIKKTRDRSNDHPTRKPVDLFRHLMRLVTPPGGVTLDPFMGSGTAALAAKAEGFRSIGIERDERYFDIAVKRVRLQDGLTQDVEVVR